MKMKYLIVFLTCAFTSVKAQVNFVKNGGFEHYNNCPYPRTLDNIDLAKYWSPLDTNETLVPYSVPLCAAEYFNSCAPAGSLLHIPNNGYFNHYPRSGQGMADFQSYFDNSYSETYQRDYIQGRFYDNLVSGASYCITFYVSLFQSSQYAINHLGAYIDDGAIDAGQDSVGCARPQTAFHPQIVEDSIIKDTLNWVKVQGNFTANGTEKFITVGNFFDIYHTDTIVRQLWYYPWNTMNPFSWYLIDDVSVIPSGTIADAGPHEQWVSPGSDSVFIGIPDEGLPTTWYIAGNPTPLCYGWGGFKVHPDTTTTYVVVLDLCGNVTSDTVTVRVAPLGESGVRGAAERVRVWPNPASGLVYVEGGEGCVVGVYDMLGRCVAVGAGKVIDIWGLTNGVYSIVITDPVSGERVLRKVVKE